MPAAADLLRQGEQSRGSRTFTLNFTGDVMLGRLIDQLFPQHVIRTQNTDNRAGDSSSSKEEADLDRDARIIASFRARHPYLHHYSAEHPWASTLPLFRSADLNLINLETAATTHDVPWPHKVFNYRMHPANVPSILRAACIDFASLANNHTLDFGPEGLIETVRALRSAKVAFAGAGETTDEAMKPAVLQLPRAQRVKEEKEKEHGKPDLAEMTEVAETRPTHAIHVYAAADHPRDWAVVPTFHLILNPSSLTSRRRLKRLLGPQEDGGGRPSPTTSSPSTPPPTVTAKPPSLKIFSIHWGPNYSWRPNDEIRSLARFLIDECGVDIVHGHSSHHIQGVERYQGKLILYGCGDFVDDYALNATYRNDLGAIWQVKLREEEEEDELATRNTTTSTNNTNNDNKNEEKKDLHLYLDKLEIFPTRIDTFQAHLLDPSDDDHGWVREKITTLSEELGTTVSSQLGEQGQLIVDLR